MHAFSKADAEEEAPAEPQSQPMTGIPSNQDLADMINAMKDSRSAKGGGKGKKGDGKGAKKKGNKFLSADAGNVVI